MKQKAGAAVADMFAKHVRERTAKIDFPPSVFRLQVRLDLSPLCLLLNSQCAEVFGDVFVDFEAQRFAGSEWTTASKERVEDSILAGRKQHDV